MRRVVVAEAELLERLRDGAGPRPAIGRVIARGRYNSAVAILLGLWASGLYLWFLPWSVKWRKKSNSPAGPGSS